MTEQEKRKSGGGKLTRSETVTVRLDPKLRYLAELAALKQRRTLSSFIEWAIEDSLTKVILAENVRFDGSYPCTVADEAGKLWDVDEPDRFAKLALHYPELLTHEEQKRWKFIRENGYLWRGSHHKVTGKWTWKIEEGSFCFDRLREHWDTFVAVSKGEVDKGNLPTWVDTKKPEEGPFQDIPF